VQKRRT